MTALVEILRALLSLASNLTSYLQQKQLLDAGEALAINKGLQDAKDTVNKAREARTAITSNNDDELFNEDDPNLRD